MVPSDSSALADAKETVSPHKTRTGARLQVAPRLEVHTDLSAISRDTALAREWNELAEQVGASPYLRPEWVIAWWRAFGAGKLEIRTLRANGKLAAVLPVIKHYCNFKSAANSHSPRFGMLSKDMTSATELARTMFNEKPHRVSIAALDPAGTSIKACWRAAAQAGYRAVLRPYQSSPYLEIRGSWQDYESRLSKKLLLDLRRCRKKLERLGKVSVQVVDGRQQLYDYLEEAFLVEASGWKGKSKTAIRSAPDTMRFYTDVARWAAACGMLRIFFLRLDQRPIAMYYMLLKDSTCYMLKGGYDAAFARYSPGKTLMHEVVSYCFSLGLSNVEFHGDANQYKFRWANAVHTQKRFEACSPSLVGRVAWAFMVYGKPAIKSMLRYLGFRK